MNPAGFMLRTGAGTSINRGFKACALTYTHALQASSRLLASSAGETPAARNGSLSVSQSLSSLTSLSSGSGSGCCSTTTGCP